MAVLDVWQLEDVKSVDYGEEQGCGGGGGWVRVWLVVYEDGLEFVDLEFCHHDE